MFKLKGAMALWYVAVSERHLDPAEDVDAGHISGHREHVHSQDLRLVQIPAHKNNQVMSDW